MSRPLSNFCRAAAIAAFVLLGAAPAHAVDGAQRLDVQVADIRAQLDKLSSQANALTHDTIESSEKKLTALLGAPTGFFAAPSTDVTLSRINAEASALYQQVWQADAEPTSSQMATLSATEHESVDVLKHWNDFKSSDLPALNRLLRESKIPEVQLEADLHQEEPQIDEE